MLVVVHSLPIDDLETFFQNSEMVIYGLSEYSIPINILSLFRPFNSHMKSLGCGQ